MSTIGQKLAALKAGTELPCSTEDLWNTPVGQVPDTDVRAVLGLAQAIHHAESEDIAVSWSAQERARTFFNEHGLSATLTEMFRLEHR